MTEGKLSSKAGCFSMMTNGGEHFDNPVVREEFRIIMGAVIIIHSNYIRGLDMITYTALCEQFDPLEAGEAVPRYQPMFNMDDEGNKSVVFIKEELTQGGQNEVPH